MAGQLVPLALFRRFTTFSGVGAFATSALDVSKYAKALVTIWKGGTTNSGNAKFTFEESTDQSDWTLCDNTPELYDPGDDTQRQVIADLKKRWFRLRVDVTGTSSSVTLWAVGFLEKRES